MPLDRPGLKPHLLPEGRCLPVADLVVDSDFPNLLPHEPIEEHSAEPGTNALSSPLGPNIRVVHQSVPVGKENRRPMHDRSRDEPYDFETRAGEVRYGVSVRVEIGQVGAKEILGRGRSPPHGVDALDVMIQVSGHAGDDGDIPPGPGPEQDIFERWVSGGGHGARPCCLERTEPRKRIAKTGAGTQKEGRAKGWHGQDLWNLEGL